MSDFEGQKAAADGALTALAQDFEGAAARWEKAAKESRAAGLTSSFAGYEGIPSAALSITRAQVFGHCAKELRKAAASPGYRVPWTEEEVAAKTQNE